MSRLITSVSSRRKTWSRSSVIFLYRKRKEKQYIPNFKDYIQGANWAQFATSDKYIIDQNKTTLKQLYNEINALTS